MKATSGTAIGAGLLAVSLLAATVAFYRWEVVHEPVPGVPLPERGRLVAADADDVVAGAACQLVVEVPGAPERVIGAWWTRLRRRQWESAPAELERSVFRRPGQRLLVNVNALPGSEPWTRLRITVRPCRVAEGGAPEHP